MKVYLAGPINGMSDEMAKSWRGTAREMLEKRGLEILDPMVRDYRGKEELNIEALVEQDKRDIDEADAILANVWKVSAGTSMEIFYAWSLGKPVITLITPGSRPSPWVSYHSTYVTTSLLDACEQVARK